MPQNLAGGALGNIRNPVNGFGHLVFREPLPAKALYICPSGSNSRAWDDIGCYNLVIQIRAFADDRAAQNIRVLVEGVFHILGIDL